MLIHAPRVIGAIVKGWIRRSKILYNDKNNIDWNIIGMNHTNPYISYGRAGLFDVDQFMHMNNASYLAHAEYARWEAMAMNGIMSSMIQDNVIFVVGNTSVRFRREIKPIFRQFEIHSYVAALDERTMWIYHTFRYPEGGKDPGRVRAQVICQGHAIQNKTVLDPRIYFRDNVGIDANIVDELSQGAKVEAMADLLLKFQYMDDAFKVVASQDDDELEKKR